MTRPTPPRSHSPDPLAEDWTEQPPIPDSWLGITGPLSDEQEEDLEAYCRYVRYTVDIDRWHARPAIPTHWIIPIPRWWLRVKSWFAKVSSFPEDQP